MARPVAVGAPAPPRPPGCDIVYSAMEPGEAAKTLRQVGVLCVSYMASTPSGREAFSEAHDEVVEGACKLGGFVVAPLGACSNGKMNGVELGVYRPRDAPE